MFSMKPRAPEHKQRGTAGAVEKAIAAARAGMWGEARAQLIAFLCEQPNHSDAWFWLACVTENAWEALSSLRKAFELAPHRSGLREAIAWVQGEIAAGRNIQPMSAPFVPVATVPAGPSVIFPRLSLPRRAAWGLSVMAAVIVLTALGFGLRLLISNSNAPALSEASNKAVELAAQAWEEAWAQGDWPRAIAQLEELSAREPTNLTWRSRLFEAHLKWGEELAQNGRLEQALTEFQAAMALRPYDAELQQARGLAARYLIGVERFQAGDWAGAIDVLNAIYTEKPDYRETRELLYSAYYNLGLACQSAGLLSEAESAYRQALHFSDDSAEVESRLRHIDRLLNPPTPTPSLKRIEVDLSKQRLYAYEGDQLVYDFICSTGDDSSPTAPGHYRILDKLPMAYASTWNLQMPYWMGIYWSGTLENGIHALPILKNGQILWDGYLGQRVSFGCIILSTEAARMLYEWAEVGIPVIIHP